MGNGIQAWGQAWGRMQALGTNAQCMRSSLWQAHNVRRQPLEVPLGRWPLWEGTGHMAWQHREVVFPSLPFKLSNFHLKSICREPPLNYKSNKCHSCPVLIIPKQNPGERIGMGIG